MTALIVLVAVVMGAALLSREENAPEWLLTPSLYISRTAEKLGIYNVPTDPMVVSNLARLERALDEVYGRAGYSINVAFRTGEGSSIFGAGDVNAEVGGQDNSLHKIGCAADIKPLGMSIADAALKARARRDLFREVVVYPGHLHLAIWEI